MRHVAVAFISLGLASSCLGTTEIAPAGTAPDKWTAAPLAEPTAPYPGPDQQPSVQPIEPLVVEASTSEAESGAPSDQARLLTAVALGPAPAATRTGGCSDAPGIVAITGDDWFPTDESASDTPSTSATAALARLMLAYESNSADETIRFFDEWAASSKAVSGQELRSMDPTARAAYEAFAVVFTPMDHTELTGFGGYTSGEESDYVEMPYIVTPGDMLVFCDDSLRAPNDMDLSLEGPDSYLFIDDFRPNVSAGQARILHLTPDYEYAINAFLGGEHHPPGSGGSVMNPATAAGVSRARWEFLEPFIHLVPGHWGGYWHILSHPEINMINLNESLGRAILPYRIGYQGGDAEVVHEADGTWRLTKAGLNWIE